MLKFMQSNLRYKECVEGMVVVQFVIDTTGQVIAHQVCFTHLVWGG